MGTVFGNAIGFLNQLGVFEVVLPFILVFTMVFAFLEKTKIYGIEKYITDDGKTVEGPRRNLDAMTAFVVAFFVVASSQIVAVINKTLSQVVLLLVLSFSFMLVAGSFHNQPDKDFALSEPWKKIFMVIVFIGIMFIFINALGWWQPFYRWVLGSWNNQASAALILVLLLIGSMYLITKEPSNQAAKKEE